MALGILLICQKKYLGQCMIIKDNNTKLILLVFKDKNKEILLIKNVYSLIDQDYYYNNIRT